jgi:hypothetical protein
MCVNTLHREDSDDDDDDNNNNNKVHPITAHQGPRGGVEL